MLLPYARAALLLGGSILLLACSPAKYNGRTDYDASCPAQIEYPCRPGAAGAPANEACAPDPSAKSDLLAGVPPDASYPPGCVVIVPDKTPDDLGQCTILGTCRCVADGGAAAWSCAP